MDRVDSLSDPACLTRRGALPSPAEGMKESNAEAQRHREKKREEERLHADVVLIPALPIFLRASVSSFFTPSQEETVV